MECLVGDNCFRILDKNQYIIFYFTASWCKPCQKIYPDILKLIEKLDKTKILLFKIEIDNDLNDEICKKCNIKSVPSFLLFKQRTLLSNFSGSNIDLLINMINNFCK